MPNEFYRRQKLPPGLTSSHESTGVTVYGINGTSDQFEPIFHIGTAMEAEQIIKNLCHACKSEGCKPWQRKINVCFQIVINEASPS